MECFHNLQSGPKINSGKQKISFFSLIWCNTNTVLVHTIMDIPQTIQYILGASQLCIHCEFYHTTFLTTANRFSSHCPFNPTFQGTHLRISSSQSCGEKARKLFPSCNLRFRSLPGNYSGKNSLLGGIKYIFIFFRCLRHILSFFSICNRITNIWRIFYFFRSYR